MGCCYCEDLKVWRNDAKILGEVIKKSKKGLENFQKADDSKKNIDNYFLKSKENDAFYINDNSRLHTNIANFKKNLKLDFETVITDMELSLSSLNSKIDDYQKLDDDYHEEENE